MIYVHIGAGAGDQDSGANFRDGFTEFVKQSNDIKKEIYVVEANPSNISKLKLTWINYPQVKIFNFAISTKENKKIKFYYSLDDAPHYQVFSNDINHILKYYKDLKKIKNKLILSKHINIFLEENFKNKIINYFSIDIEGMEDRALAPFLITENSALFPRLLIIETVNRDDWEVDVLQRLAECGYVTIAETRGNSVLALLA